MKRVFIVRFENVDVFTSARKAIEHAKKVFEGANISEDWDVELSINDVPTEKLITKLNNWETVTMDLGGMDQAEMRAEVLN